MKYNREVCKTSRLYFIIAYTDEYEQFTVNFIFYRRKKNYE